MQMEKKVANNYKPGWIDEIDKRTSLSVELRNRHNLLCNDLGGFESLSYQEKSLVDRVIFLEFHLQQQERDLMSGGEFDSGKWVQAVNSLQGIYSKLGLKRVAKEPLNISEFLQKKASKQ